MGVTYMPTDQFLAAVYKTITDAVGKAEQQHPEDIMSTVSLVTETIYQFISHMPFEMMIIRK